MEEVESLIKPSEDYPHSYFGSNLESRRWWILLSFGIFNGLAAMIWITYNSMTGLCMEYYDINESQVLLFSDTGVYTNFMFSFILCWYAFKKFKYSFLFSVGSMTVATWIRYAAGSNYALALIGQTITGIAGSTIFGLATLIPIRWFSLKERFLVTTISIYSNNLGWALGTILGPILVHEDSSKIPRYLLVQAIIATIGLILSLFCVKEKPNEPPSYSAFIEIIDPSTFWEEIKNMLEIPKFIPSALCFAISLGISYSISTIGTMYLEPFGLSYLEKGFIELSYVLSGTLTGLFGTLWIENKKMANFDFMIKAFLTLSLLALVLSGAVLWKMENPRLLIIVIAHCFLGIGLIGITPFLFSAIIEITFPIKELMSSNSLYVLAQLFNLITGRLILAVDKKIGLIVLAVFMLPSWRYGVFKYTTDYKRRNADEKHPKFDENMRSSIEKDAKEEKLEDQIGMNSD